MPTASNRSEEENLMVISPETGCASASVTVAVAVLVELPLAKITGGASCTITVVAGPTVWMRDAVPEGRPAGVLSVAVMIGDLTAVVLVIVAV